MTTDLHLRTFRLSPLDMYLAEAERFWALSEPHRLLRVATTDARGGPTLSGDPPLTCASTVGLTGFEPATP